MKLCDAILLGDSLKKADDKVFLNIRLGCGCAIGGAMLAAGIAKEVMDEIADLTPGQPLTKSSRDVARSAGIRKTWPWLTTRHVINISNLYSSKMDGEVTIEDIAAYVRSIEPPEAEPQEPQAEEEVSDVRPELEVYRGR